MPNDRTLEALKIIKELEPFVGQMMDSFIFEVIPEGRKAKTNGRVIQITESFLNLPANVLAFVLLHEGLHNVLNHSAQLETKDPKVYNYATDVIVNDIILKYPFNPGISGFVTGKERGIPNSDQLSLIDIYERILPTRRFLKIPPGATIEDMTEYDPVASEEIKKLVVELLKSNKYTINNPLLKQRLQETYSV